jgi:hypothetical protein
MNILTTVNGNPFPMYEGQALSWSIGLYHTLAEQELGFPRARRVIHAMRQYRPEQLEQERRDYLKATFDQMFGHNARIMLALIESPCACGECKFCSIR